MKKFLTIATALLLVASTPIFAKGGSSFSSGRSSSFNSTPRSSSTNTPVTVPSTRSTTPSSSGSFSFPGSSTKTPFEVPTKTIHTVTSSPPPPKTAYTQSVNRSVSTAEYNKRASVISQNRSSPVFTSSVGNKTYSPAQVSTVRTTYVSHYYVPVGIGYTHAYSSLYTDLFLWNMLWDSTFAYNHWNDPSYQAMLADARARGAQDQKLQDQITALNAQVNQMKAEGKPVDPNYMPNDVPKEVAFNEDALTGKVQATTNHMWWWIIGSLGAMVVLFSLWFVFRRRGQ